MKMKMKKKVVKTCKDCKKFISKLGIYNYNCFSKSVKKGRTTVIYYTYAQRDKKACKYYEEGK